jgi:FkbM family methyltransferase
VLKFSLCGIEVSLLAGTPLELRCIEATWFSEQEMLSAVLSKLKSGDVFLDVGSNLGMITVFAARAVGSRGMVFAFEPETTAHTRLLENIRLNNLDNVKVFTEGLSCSRGNRNLLLGDEDGVSQSSRISEADGRSKIIETVDYDWLVDSQLFCEVHPADLPKGVTVEQVLELIGSLGFKDIVAKDRAAQLQVFAGKEHKEKPRWSSSSLVRSDL